ncbi:hypothetical protein PG996_003246 [Apiospora saccharicola]|uniref:Fungal N-terminal domain-containing protein n=1 Tax=Apiospora saccharicola TaxID=335842 RepID=A0ABR1W3B9_9PEZI
MAEALGLAASVAGLLSLGLQVTGGFASYLDALENRQEELASAKRQNDALAASLDIVKTASTHVLSHHAHTITTSIQSCEAELQAAEVLLADLANCDTSTWRQRLRSKKKKLSYRFDRAKVQKLVQRLHNSNQVLQLALAGLNLEMTGCSIERLAAIESSTSGHGSELLVLRSEVSAAITPLTDMRDRVVTTDQLQESNRAMQGMFEHSHESLQLQLSLQSERIARFEKLLESLQSPGVPNQSVGSLAHKAARKPAVLRELCDTTWALDQEPYRHDSSGLATYQLPDHPSIRVHGRRGIPAIETICICPRSHRSTSHKTIWLGHLGLSEGRESRGHWPGCPLSRIQSTQKHRRTVGVKYTGLTRLLYSVVGVSFTLTSGAGGFSIGANLTYNTTVDISSDPSFRIMKIIENLVFYNSVETDALFMVASIKRLQRLLDEKKVYPTAVSTYNCNLLYFATSAISISEGQINSHVARHFPQLIKTLLQYGVPAFTYDDQGVSPLARFCTMERPTKEVEDVIHLLVSANPKGRPAAVDPSKLNFYRRGPWTLNTALLYGVSYGYAEACDCGPLSKAVVRNDIHEVARILDRFPSSILEMDIHGQSPLHLAALKPAILFLLVQVANTDTLERADKSGISAIEVAMMRSGDRCIYVFDTRIRLHDLLAPASELAKRRYIFELQQRILYRTKSSWKSIFHHDNANAADTLIDGTESCGINSNRGSNEEVGQYGWVYEEICDTHMADLFYRYGFRLSPSFFLDARLNLIRMQYHMKGHITLYIGWLVEHGVDLFAYISSRSSTREDDPGFRVFGAHHAFWIMGMSSCTTRQSFDRSNMAAISKISTTVMRYNLTDGCQCHCTTGGCTPFVWMLKGAEGGRTSIDRTKRYMETYYSRCGRELTVLTYETAIRYATFQALGLNHTCCDSLALAFDVYSRKTNGSPWFEADDVASINEDQAPLLELLEELVAEFTRMAEGYQERGCFKSFWATAWVVRIKRELVKLDGCNLSDAERQGAEEIGVMWCEPPNVKETEAANPYDLGSTEWCFFELDLICPEYREPWPEELHPIR